MSTVTKKELIEHIAQATNHKRVIVKQVVQEFLDQVIVELGQDNRLEFRDFGVFEVKLRQPRMAQNPKTLEPVWVPAKRSVRFKTGRQMRHVLAERDAADAPPGGGADHDGAGVGGDRSGGGSASTA
ncbi:HU family DNA-binding protein [Phycisphaera mikurensis]|uniref:Putative DNA-binding protein n=1 Tax=Phycisphaera mikurensis (strain NBRC 102666 / KCTC 22515 / FYK2301M01) TaxID=1142394 RepID=I0IH41_PHYMF|nr:HU family DNA-binding protein [Phycisphaera mikurensis]MBB6440833.1 integration host factor subunit beta [Phycisphaera mikurensis]BAM04579.1 putative DNA-binding protein [Phycisphaera mikurensis NBRC 102666]